MLILKVLPVLWHKEFQVFPYVASFSSPRFHSFLGFTFVLGGLLESIKSRFGGSSVQNSTISEKLAKHICNIMCNLSFQSSAMSYVYAVLFRHILRCHVQNELSGRKGELIRRFTMEDDMITSDY